MTTASASNSFTRRYVSLTMSGFPCTRVSVERRSKERQQKKDRHEVLWLKRTINGSIGVRLNQRVDERVAERLPYIRRDPQELQRHLLGVNDWGDGCNTTPCGDEDDAAE